MLWSNVLNGGTKSRRGFHIMNQITPDAYFVVQQIKRFWPHLFHIEFARNLKEIFPEPDNVGLKHIWKYGEADIVVCRKGKIIAIFEPGGFQHIFDKKQAKNDRRKWKLCEINGVSCCHIMNGVLAQCSNRKQRSLLGKFLF